MLGGVPKDASGRRMRIVRLNLYWDSASDFSAILGFEILDQQGDIIQKSLWRFNKKTDLSNFEHYQLTPNWDISQSSDAMKLTVNDIGLDNHLVLTLK